MKGERYVDLSGGEREREEIIPHLFSQVLGCKPYQDYACRSTRALATRIIRTTKAPMKVESTYIKNLAALVSECTIFRYLHHSCPLYQRYFVREKIKDNQGTLHKLFAEWVGDGISELTWDEIIDDDK